jgi:pimeloyl-[acyl-carrier protein] methyl ester esterase
MAEILAFHGWGFDRTCWDALRTRLPSGASFRSFDRGYFGTPREVAWGPERSGARVLVVHSMGTFFLSPELRQGADALVLFGGFRQFHPPEPRERTRSRRVVSLMRAELEADPAAVLTAFYRNCGMSDPRTSTSDRAPRTDRLVRDLDRLSSESIEPGDLSPIPRILLLHGTEDPIVPQARGEELFTALPPGARWLTVPGAGHALPFTHPHVCLPVLEDLLEEGG